MSVPTPNVVKNPLLSDADQERDYIIKMFIVQPEVIILTPDGKEERRYLAQAIAMNEAQLGDTLPAWMEKLGLKMKQGADGK